MGKKAKAKGRSTRRANPRVPVISSRSTMAKQVDSAVEGEETGPCKHFKREDEAVKSNLLRIHSSSGADDKCEDCREEPGGKKVVRAKGKNMERRRGASKSEVKAETGTVWVCLDCNHLGCGGGHSVAVRLDNASIGWCFACNSSIPIEITPLQNGEPNRVADIDVVWFGKDVEKRRMENGGSSLPSERKGGYSVRGLTNLGNTCFFNSVTQNLLAMERLRSYFLNLDQDMGPLTMALKKLFVETSNGSDASHKSRITPNNLFGSVCSKAPQFKGYQQQDSHELLRYLLDGLCTEHSNARKSAAKSKSDETGSESEEDQAISGPSTTFVDAIFGGQLSSTVCCTVCGHSSVVFEPFLDLSLPIPVKKPPPRLAPVALPKRGKLSSREEPRGSGRRIREKKPAMGMPKLEMVESASSVSESSVPSCSVKPEPEQESRSEPGQVVAPDLWDDSLWTDYVEPVVESANSVSEFNVPLCSVKPEQTPESGPEQGQDIGPDLDSWWMDYIEPMEISDYLEPVSKTSFSSFVYGPQNEEEITDSANGVPGIPPAQHPGVILLPYEPLGSTRESQDLANMGLGQTAAGGPNDGILSSEADFDGFGDLFNEQEESAPDAKEETSNFDDSNAPVSVDRCLACFTTPELLSDEQAWGCENCSKIFQRQGKERRRGGSKGSEFGGRDSLGSVDNGVQGVADEYCGESEPAYSCSSCGSSPRRRIPQAGSSNEENYFSTGEAGSYDEDELVEGLSASSRLQGGDDGAEERTGNGGHSKIKRDATKRILIEKTPHVLTIHLKRFSQDARGRLSKLNGHVSFQETLDLRPYMNSRSRDVQGSSYRLVGVVEHEGSMRGGHYHGPAWFYASDGLVREVSLPEVLQSEAYILFYERL
ncbi:unnamed protein product [Spirodela intermedia]|uniref:USP domain-containing protein n=1 Tax=Spirodela intermedia TaxID=51605 RepID=A0A7I8JCK5_SPIIN|nr:unnamed protein product [Spirodela intermedia]CAA6667906.1 unnamed protein product [Spirodela intermedia]